MRILNLFILLVFFISNVYADGTAGERELKKVRVVNGDIITIEAVEGFQNPDNCGSSSFAVIRQDDPGADRKLSLALSAFMGGKKVGAYFTGCVDTVWGHTAPLLYTIYVVN